MKRLLVASVACSVLALSASSLAAHDRYRIIGTVTKLTADEITVKQTKDNALIEMDIDQNTKVTRDGKAAKRADVKVGGSVVVEALGDSILDLVVLEVRLVPAIPSTKKPG